MHLAACGSQGHTNMQRSATHAPGRPQSNSMHAQARLQKCHLVTHAECAMHCNFLLAVTRLRPS